MWCRCDNRSTFHAASDLQEGFSDWSEQMLSLEAEGSFTKEVSKNSKKEETLREDRQYFCSIFGSVSHNSNTDGNHICSEDYTSGALQVRWLQYTALS